MRQVDRTFVRKWELSDDGEMYSLAMYGDLGARVYENEDYGGGYLATTYCMGDVIETFGPYKTLEEAFSAVEESI